MNKLRKDKLAKRAIAYGKRKHPDHTLTVVWAASDGFERGYREAMRDMRKALQDTERNLDTGLPMAIRRGMLLGAIRNFLLPLR